MTPKPETLLADTGYFSAANVEACEKAGIEPLIAMGRQPHHPPLTERFETAPPAAESDVGRGDGASAEDAGRQEGLCSAQTDPGTGVNSVVPGGWRKSLILPVMHNIAVKVDEARDLVGP